MENILKELWRGGIFPAEECGKRVPRDAGLQNLADAHEAILSVLTDEGQTLLDRFENELCREYGDYAEKAFIYGAKLGMRLILEMEK